ncbi:MAG: tripartite tricarboxylate transporter substrate binding protein [Pigmentiphaga sp.]|uniref:tripartite tricarboxylate transporter substrate binding protein n=1 Tax=Pigmentiphaga sp. TaxID=1977564 RepID=UPI0029B4E088|nr:tripartite tricarboxylate transporter substrate binding protein [Pigmentiphaga sp.]MDX3904454.1 tripartite tricarboxylate transporter substrate binding protein [Pigmentiphaga sp.]
MNKLIACLFPCLALAAAPAVRAEYPEKPVRIIVGSTAGGVTDTMARLIGSQLTQRLGQSFVVENRPGASGVIGLSEVHRAPADGYTLTMVPANIVVFKALYGNLNFDPVEDFAPIVHVGNSPIGVSVHASFPAKNLKELIAYARSHDVSYASCGPGTPQHLAAEQFREVAGLRLTHIPYKGCGQALTDVLAGRVPVFFASIPHIVEGQKSGRIAPVAVTGQARSPLLPGAPTLVEAGYKDVMVDAWFGLIAAKGTPQPVIGKINAAVNELLKQPETRQKMAAQYVDPVGGTPASFGTLIRRDADRLSGIVRAVGIKAE